MNKSYEVCIVWSILITILTKKNEPQCNSTISMPLLLKTHTKKPWYVTWACDMEVTNSNYHCRAGSCRGWAGRASHQRLLPLGRKARRTLSGRGGGAPRPPATLSCKAGPADYVGGLSLP